MKAEWIKFRTLRSSWLTLGAAVALMVIVGLVIGYATSTADWGAASRDGSPPLDDELKLASAPVRGFLIAQLVVGVLGILLVTGEYATGMIRSTFTAVPRRLQAVGAKAAVFGVAAVVAMTLASFAAFYGAQIFLGPHGHGSSISDPGVLRSVAGAGLYLTLVGLLGAGIGWIARSTAGAITALVGLLLILPNLIPLLSSWADRLARYMPSNAGESFMTSARVPDTLAPVTGIGVLALWVAATFVAAAVLVRRRDA
jgi:ABC-type transport system involved in multi-copper enzyme maturation permease subunit